jgi:uncharacterized protein YndB with AHSA1/START domain
MKLRYERLYAFPRAAVWSALTDARAIRQWWVETDFVPEPGRSFFFQDTPQRGWDGRVTGRVLSVESERRIEFSWQGGGHETVVKYELFDAPGGTRFVLTHDGFRGLSGLFLSTMLRFGWRHFLNELLLEMASHIASHGFSQPFLRPPKAAVGRSSPNGSAAPTR